MKWRVFAVIFVVFAVTLTGCGSSEPAPATEVDETDAPAGVRGGLAPVDRLALGTFKLEGTENALTATQAAELLPLWKLIEGGSLQSEVETNAVVQQIEGKMDDAQLAAIDGLGLTFEDTRAWMEEMGIEMPAPPAGPGGPGGPGEAAGQSEPAAGQSGPGALQNMSEEERAKMREEFQNMSAEERATRMAALPTEARGIERPEGAGTGPGAGRGGSSRQGNVLLASLVELLTERAAA